MLQARSRDQAASRRATALDAAADPDLHLAELDGKRGSKRFPHAGIGKPEPLRHALTGYWPRRIDDEHRIVYKAAAEAILIAQLRYHY